MRFLKIAQLVNRNHIVAPDSLLYGLGLAFYLYKDRVACYPKHAVIDGLGFLTAEELQTHGLTPKVRQAAVAIHYRCVGLSRTGLARTPTDPPRVRRTEFWRAQHTL